jgi:hypothetical protein
MRSKMQSVKYHLLRHRFKYGVATGIAVSGYFIYKRGQEWNEFLNEHGIYDEFYATAE